MSKTRRSASGSLPLATWKCEPPRQSATVLARPRLIARIDSALGKHQSSGDVFLLSAPAGYGKTTLLAQWAQTTPLPVMWYHIDSSDDDPAALISGLVSSLRTQLPRGHWQVREMLAHLPHGTPSPDDVRRAAEVFAADIRAHVTRPMALILTGVAELSAKGSARAVIEHLLARTPDHLRLLLEFREVPPLRLAPLLPQHRLDGIGLDDLRLTQSETTELLDTLGIAADADYRARLEELCCGWVTGVLLATGALWPDCLAPHASDELNREAVFGYLASEVIDRLPPTLADFAMRTSILPTLTAPLCTALLGTEDARERLNALERRTGFLTHVGRRPQEPLYRLQPLLRQALLDRLQASAGVAAVRALRLQAGELLAASGEYEEAVQQYGQTHAYDRLVELIERVREQYLRAGRGATLARWLDLLPEDVRGAYPHLMILLAELHRQAGRTAEAFAAIERACERLTAHDEATDTLAARALTVRADLLYIRGQYTEAIADVDRSLARVPISAPKVSIQAHLVKAACINLLHGPAAAQASLEGLAEQCQHLGDIPLLARLSYVTSNLLFSRGAYAEAEQAATAALRYAEETEDVVRAIACRLTRGACRQLRGNANGARADFTEAAQQSEACGHTQGRAYAMANLAELAFTDGNYGHAFALFQAADDQSKASDDSHLYFFIQSRLAYLHSLHGSPQQAVTCLEPVVSQLKPQTPTADLVMTQIALAFAVHKTQNFDRAIHLARVAGDNARCLSAEAELARAQVILAASLLAKGESRSAHRVLLEVMQQVDDGLDVMVVLTELLLLPEASQHIAQIDHPKALELAQMLKANTLLQARTEHAFERGSRSSSLTVTLFGEPEVLHGSQRISRWRIPAARELLLFLADQGRPVRKDVILDTIWPDKDLEEADTAFRKVRAQLKIILGRQCIEQEAGYWQLTVPATVDARDFEQLVQVGEQHARNGMQTSAMHALHAALSLYSGPFVPDLYSDWAIIRRESLEQARLRALEVLAEIKVSAKQYDVAAQLYTDVIALAPYREDAHRGLMRCHAVRGEYALALRQFDQCVRVLDEELHCGPSPKTLTLATQIRSHMQLSIRQFVAAQA